MTYTATAKAHSVLAEILKNFQEGNDPLHGSALLFEDDRTLKEHVEQAVQALDEEWLNPREGDAVLPRSKRRRIGRNWLNNWNGYIGKGKQKVISFGEDRAAALRWVQETPVDH